MKGTILAALGWAVLLGLALWGWRDRRRRRASAAARRARVTRWASPRAYLEARGQGAGTVRVEEES